MNAGYQLSLRVVVLVIAVSAPLALGLETLLRTQVLAPIIGPGLDEVREFFSPQLTAVAWGMVGVCGLAGVLGLGLLRRAIDGVRLVEVGERERRLKDRLLLLTSVPQVPAILATLCFMMGSALLPVLVSMGVSTGFVLVMGFWGERACAELCADPSRGDR